mgnify:CR=1 FL=1
MQRGTTLLLGALATAMAAWCGTANAETLMHALEELRLAYAKYKDDPEFVAEFRAELKHFVGRPSPVYHAKRWSEQLGGAQENVTQTRAGTIHMTWVGMAFLSRTVPELEREFRAEGFRDGVGGDVVRRICLLG